MSYASTIQALSGLVSYWRLNENVGATTIADSSGNSNTGTVSGTITFGKTGLLIGTSVTSAEGDGTTGLASVPDSSTILTLGSNLANGFWWIFWYKFDSVVNGTAFQRPFGANGLAGINSLRVILNSNAAGSASNGDIAVFISDTTNKRIRGGTTSLSSAVNIRDGNVHQIAGYVDVANQAVTMWVDGVSQATSVTLAETPATFINLTVPLYVLAGNNNGAGIAWCYDILQEIAIGTGALTTGQVQASYAAGRLLTITGVTCSDHTANGSTDVTSNLQWGSAALVGVVSPDTVTIDHSASTGTAAQSTAGTGIAVTVAGTALGGAQGPTYSLTQPTGVTVNIVAAPSSSVLKRANQLGSWMTCGY